MKKLLIITLLFSHFSSFAFDDGSDKIIKKYLKAIGGAKEWEGIKTLQIVRHLDSENAHYDLQKISILRDKGFRNEIIINQGTPSVIGYYQNSSWRAINPVSYSISDKKTKQDSAFNLSYSPNKKLTDSLKDGGNYINLSTNGKRKNLNVNVKQIDNYSGGYNKKSHLNFLKWQTQMPWNFIDYEAKGYKATYKGDSKISIDEVSEIEMISSANDTVSYFFSKKTYLLMRAVNKNMQLNFSRYKKVDNVKIPHDVFETVTDFRFSKYVDVTPHSDFYIIDQVKLNEPMDEKIFMKPKQ